MSKWKSYLPLAIILLVGVGTFNVAESVRAGFRPDSMGVGCAVLAGVFFLYKIWCGRKSTDRP